MKYITKQKVSKKQLEGNILITHKLDNINKNDPDILYWSYLILKKEDDSLMALSLKDLHELGVDINGTIKRIEQGDYTLLVI